MKENEKEFLAQVGVGWFEVRVKDGTIWRLAKSVGGSRTGSKSYMTACEATRAERCVSRNHLKIWFTVGSRLRTAVYAHRIVWMVANKRDIPDGLEINHIDGNPRNNDPLNLEVVTRRENTMHAGRLGLLGKRNQSGTRNSTHKLTEQQVREIRKLCADRQLPQTKIAEMYMVTQETVSNIHRRITWAFLG